MGNHTHLARKNLMQVAVENVIMPSAVARRKQHVHDLLHRCGRANPPPTQQQLAAEEARLRIVLTIDGEYTQLDAMISAIAQHVDAAGAAGNIELIKFSASCSKTQQPADVSPCFMVLKSIAKREMREELPPSALPTYHDVLETDLLHPLEKSSRDVFLKFLDHLPTIADTSFMPSNIRQGFLKTGLCPFDVSQILSQCTAWASFQPKEATAAIAAIDGLVQHVRENGQLTEANLNEVCGGGVKAACERELAKTIAGKGKQPTKSVEQRPLNHRRAVHISHNTIVKERARARGLPVAGGDDADDDDDDEPTPKVNLFFLCITLSYHTSPPPTENVLGPQPPPLAASSPSLRVRWWPLPALALSVVLLSQQPRSPVCCVWMKMRRLIMCQSQRRRRRRRRQMGIDVLVCICCLPAKKNKNLVLVSYSHMYAKTWEKHHKPHTLTRTHTTQRQQVRLQKFLRGGDVGDVLHALLRCVRGGLSATHTGCVLKSSVSQHVVANSTAHPHTHLTSNALSRAQTAPEHHAGIDHAIPCCIFPLLFIFHHANTQTV